MLRPPYTAKVSGTPIQSNWAICSRNKRSKEVSGTCVQCMRAFNLHIMIFLYMYVYMYSVHRVACMVVHDSLLIALVLCIHILGYGA